MNTDTFWKIVESATASDPYSAEDWDDRLYERLVTLPPDEILAWDQFFDDLVSRAYRHDLWGAAYIINGGASDDGFYYFRCWLVGMGRTVCTQALDDPDSLADVADPKWLSDGVDAEAEIYAAAHRAWRNVTGTPDTKPYPIQSQKVDLGGDELDFDDDEAMRQTLPRLCKLYDY